MSTLVTPQDFPEIRWKGHWIWVPEEPIKPGAFFGSQPDPHQPEAHGLFRKVFHLSHMPERAPARMTADSRYALFVNGREISRGPIRSQPRRMHYDLVDLAPYLRPGENIIAAYVKYYGTSKSFWQPATPNMLLGKTGVFVFEANLGDPSTDAQDGWLVSDLSWKAKKSDAWHSELGADENSVGGGVPVEIFDARQFAPNWQSLAFDDSTWGTAQAIPAMHIGGYMRTQPPTDPYGPLFPRPIASLGGEVQKPVAVRTESLLGALDGTTANPIKNLELTHEHAISRTQDATLPITANLAANANTRIVIDMGRIVSGCVQFEVDAPAGTTFDFSYKEEPSIAPAGPIGQHSGTRYIARGQQDRFQVFDSNGFRYAYVLIGGAPGPITLTQFEVQESLYPWQAGAEFECSDPDLNAIYTAGIRTVQLNSHDAFIDCPTREQRAWVGDSVVHQMVHLATNCDWRLAWHYLTLGNSPRPDGILPMSVVGEVEANAGVTIPDWSLHWVHGVFNLYRFSGDKDAVKAFMPTIERVLRWYLPYQTSQGLLKDVVEWNLIDWASISNEDTSAVITASWARGLREFAEMAAWLEERSSQRWAEGLHAKVKAGFDVFWDEARGTYVDHMKDGVPQRAISQLAGAMAICADIAPRERWQRIIEAITDETKLVGAGWGRELDGSAKPESFGDIVRGIHRINWDVENQIVLAQPFMSYVVHDAVVQAGLADRLPQLYRRWSAFLADGYDTIGECWSWGTHVHGWSCTPTRDLVFYTLGITPAEPGFAVARVATRLGGLAWAKGIVPTPHGLLSVHVSADGVTIESPVPVIVELAGQAAQALPAGRHYVKAGS